MRIRRITVRNYAGIDEAEVRFPDTGVTIIEGVNEAGKTSLVTALDAIIDYPDSSGNKKITAIIPVGRDVGPEVEVELTTGDYEFTYRKRWKKNRETILEVTRPSREQLTGRDAHDRVTEILAETLDMGLWEALRLDQGAALGQANFEVPSLGRALDAAIGGDVAGDDEDALWTRIEDEYARYWTATGRPKAELGEAADELAEAQAAVDAARAHLRALDADAEEIERLKDRAAALREVQIGTARAVEDMADRVDAVAKVRRSLERATGELERATAMYQKARSDRERRDEQIAAFDAATEELERITGELERSSPEREALVEASNEATVAEEKARTVRENAQRAYELARADSEYRRHQIEIEQLTERRNRVVEAHEQLAEADEVVESITIDSVLLEEIEDAHLNLAKLRAAAERALPGVTVKALTDIGVVIDADTATLATDEEQTIVVDTTTSIVVPDVIEVTVTAGSDGSDVAGDLEAAEIRYEELCRRGNTTGFQDARVKADLRADAFRVRATAVETIERDLRDLTLEALSNKIDRLSRRIAEFEAARAETPPIPEDLSVAQDIERSAQDAVATAEEAATRAEELARTAKARLGEFDLGHVRLKAQLEIAETTVSSAARMLAASRQERSDDDLEATEKEALAAVATAEASIAELTDQLAELDADTLETLLENAQAAHERSVKDLQGIEDRRRELEIKLTIETDRGPARSLDEAETRLVDATIRHDHLESRAAAARVLHDTFAKHRQAARQRYNEPFRARIERLGRVVFGSTFEITLEDDLSIATRTLDGTTLDFDQLSTGAQEQLGLLARLACAMLVSGDGGAPVIIDDALGWSDPGKLDRMGAAISSAADDCQVIILTCVPDRYSAVGKACTVHI